MKTPIRLTAVIAFLLFFASAVRAQQTGEIRGTIAEERGEVLPGVSV